VLSLLLVVVVVLVVTAASPWAQQAWQGWM
jgi:hypothetical protein